MFEFRSAVGILPLHPKSPVSFANPKALIADALRQGRYATVVPGPVPGHAVPICEPLAPWYEVVLLVPRLPVGMPIFSSSEVEKFPLSMSDVGTVARIRPVSSTW